ncbi:thermonuclease family protein [Roseateles sp. BYS78W]|uniref:Thermonuclease family protein n=1 Tax=Pelomonas candidula TaxID=3299025 RepID=A0ABW7HKN4_9BURK
MMEWRDCHGGSRAGNAVQMLKLFATLAALCVSSHLAAQEVTGLVVGVHDGDTLTLLTAEKKQVQVRLADIDAPELGQPFGQAAKRELSTLCFKQRAKVQTRTTDLYGRIVGVVSCEGRDVSRVMVEHGMAWAYRMYLRRPELLNIESSAKVSHTGLWASPAVPPWEFRKTAKVTAMQASAPASGSRAPPSSQANTTVHTGPRGGKYIVNAAGHKEYLTSRHH